jgi:hypothetical protein
MKYLLAFLLLSTPAIAGDFSEHHARDPQRGSGLADTRERAAVPSGLDGVSFFGVDLADAEHDYTIGNKLGTVAPLPLQWHDVQYGPDGKLHDYGPIWADDGSDNQ